jgi:hypothetical protein
LEVRLRRAENLLRTVLPNVDLNDPSLDNLSLQQQQPLAANVKDVPQSNTGAKAEVPAETSQKDAQLRSMIESTGQLDIDESGHWDFHGGSSGTVWVKRMREQFGGLLGMDHGAPFLPRLPRPNMAPIQDSPRSATESPLDSNLPNTMDLPSRECAKALCQYSLDRACSLLRFVHQPTFYEMFNRIYDTPVENFGDNENRFLPLLYVVLALGCMFHDEQGKDPTGLTGHNTYADGIEQGQVISMFKTLRPSIRLFFVSSHGHLAHWQEL